MPKPEAQPTFNAADYRLEQCRLCNEPMPVPAHAKRQRYTCRACIAATLGDRCEASARTHRVASSAARSEQRALVERIARARNGGAAC